LRDVSLAVHQGETVGVIGRNGSGKSTLLQIICGTLTPTTGRVTTTGRVAALLELGAGFNPEFTGRENVYLNASVLGLEHAEIDARFDSIVAFSEIGDFIDQPVKTYSSGMYVRLAFAVIAHVDADVLVIDEALAVGDFFFTQKCMRFLRGFMARGTVIFVSHDTTAVQSLCDRAVWIEHGEIRFIGSAKDASERYLEAVYEAQQGSVVLPVAEESAPVDSPVGNAPAESPAPESVDESQDLRLAWLNCSPFRNDIEIFAFDPTAAGFGTGDGRITSVRLTDPEGRPYAWVVGGEAVTLMVQATASSRIDAPIIGFLVRDRLGQALFGDNTYLVYRDAPRVMRPGESVTARFEFRMPVLPSGDYSVTVALAAGTQQDHVQHHWMHDALIFRSHSTSVHQGLIGIPMKTIELIASS
jgi:lipopolysaccharide transport system ATP-binding protein